MSCDSRFLRLTVATKPRARAISIIQTLVHRRIHYNIVYYIFIPCIYADAFTLYCCRAHVVYVYVYNIIRTTGVCGSILLQGTSPLGPSVIWVLRD